MRLDDLQNSDNLSGLVSKLPKGTLAGDLSWSSIDVELVGKTVVFKDVGGHTGQRIPGVKVPDSAIKVSYAKGLMKFTYEKTPYAIELTLGAYKAGK